MTWIQRQEKPESETSLMWLDGDAGAGKTVIAHALARRCQTENILAASFFFCLSDDRLSDGAKFISTLAYQIWVNIPGTRPYIEAAISLSPLIFQRSVEEQLRSLIMEPLKQFRATHTDALPSYAIIIDALDECGDAGFQTSVIQAFVAVSKPDLSLLRVIITSRAEDHISSTFNFVNLSWPQAMRFYLDDQLAGDKPGDLSITPPLPDLTFGSWIWTWEKPYSDPPVGPRPFRKAVIIPEGRFVDSLAIDIACDDIFALYVNGKLLGSGKQWTTGHRWSITFPLTNKLIVAVYATNDPINRSWAGLIASAVLWDSNTYNGKMYYTVKTDDVWKSLGTVPPRGFERISLDDSSWSLARSEGEYGAQPWESQVKIPLKIEPLTEGFTGVMGVPDSPKAPRATPGGIAKARSTRKKTESTPSGLIPDFASAEWIWTQEQPYNDPPIGPRRFRKTVLIPSGRFVDSLTIDITCDDLHTLYINEKVVGFGLRWHVPRRWSITFPRTNKLVIAVYASNDPEGQSFAGLLAAAIAWDSADIRGGSVKINTDSSWKYGGTSAWNGLEQPLFDEDDWKSVRAQGIYGGGPWGQARKPTALNPITEGFKGIKGIPDPPRAPLATPGLNASWTVFI